MAKLSGPEFLAGIVLIAIGFFAAGAGLLQFPTAPAGTANIADHSAMSSWSSSGHELGTWTPTIDGRFAGFSVKVRDAQGVGSSLRVDVVVSCGDVDLWNAGISSVGVEGGRWITATSAALLAKQGRNVTTSSSCTFEVFFDPAIVQLAVGSSPAFVVWGFPAPSAGSAPGSTVSSDSDANVETEEGTTPNAPGDELNVAAMAITALVLLVLILGAVLLALGVAGLFG